MVGKTTRCFVAGDVTMVVSGLIEAEVLERVSSRTDRRFVKAIAVGLDLLGLELISSMDGLLGGRQLGGEGNRMGVIVVIGLLVMGVPV